MEIHKSPVSPAIQAVLPGRREMAVAADKADPRRVGSSQAPVERDDRVYAYDRGELEPLIRQLEERHAMAGEYQARQHSGMLPNRTKQALNAYQMQQDLPHDESLRALRQMLGVDDYA
jgi:hypothetical protein